MINEWRTVVVESTRFSHLVWQMKAGQVETRREPTNFILTVGNKGGEGREEGSATAVCMRSMRPSTINITSARGRTVPQRQRASSAYVAVSSSQSPHTMAELDQCPDFLWEAIPSSPT